MSVSDLVTLPRARKARLAADAARDRGDWAEAERQYAAFLSLRPNHAGVRIQHGNVLRSLGQPVAAETAYRRAIADAPDDWDAHFQLGHALRDQGRLAEAEQAFAEAARLAPGGQAVEMRELARREAREVRAAEPERASPPPPPPSPPSAAPVATAEPSAWQPDRPEPDGPLLFDVTDILEQVFNHGRATGIQRVQMGIAEPLLLAGDARVRFVFLERRLGPVRTLAPERLQAVISYCIAEPFDLGRARRLVGDAKRRSWRTRIEGAQAYVMLGAFWYLVGAGALLARMRLAGLRIGTIVYDLIPLTHPEHTSADTVQLYTRALREGAQWWDFAVTISEFTARELRTRLAGIGAPPITVTPVPLAHRIGSVAETAKPDTLPLPPAAADLDGKPFILCVGTIESRKNHLGLIAAWRMLLREGYEPPPLLLVGQRGWRVRDLLEQLEDTGYLGGRVRLLHGLSDLELEALYRRCTFSIFPSFTEGWGLPVGESLAFGKLCVASREGATPEAAGGFADLVDPYDIRGLAARVRFWLDHPRVLAQAEERLRDGFRPRGWPEVTRNFMAEVEACLARPAAAHAPASLPVLRPGGELRFDLSAQDVVLPPSVAFDAGFDPPEQFCSWIVGRKAGLRFILEGWASAPELEITLCATPWTHGNAVRIQGSGMAEPVTRGMAPDRSRTLRIQAAPDARGLVTLDIEVLGDVTPPSSEPRPIRVGLIAIRPADPAARQLPPAQVLSLLARPGTEAELEETALHLARSGLAGAPGPRGLALVAPSAELSLDTAAAAGEVLRLALHVRLAPDAPPFQVAAGRAPVTPALPAAGGDLLVYLEAEAAPGGQIPIRLTTEGAGAERIALAALAWVRDDDLPARLALLEAMGGRPGLAAGLPLADRIAAAEAALGQDGLAEGPRHPRSAAEIAAARLAATRG